MVVLGIDPGLAMIGYGVVKYKNQGWKVIEHGSIRMGGGSLPRRLKRIYDEVCRLIERHRPDELAVEQVFYAENAKTALKVAHARGVILLAGVLKDVPIAEYSPREVKQAVTGSGAASKRQVQRMVQDLLGLQEAPSPFHAADALAVALCHCNRFKIQ